MPIRARRPRKVHPSIIPKDVLAEEVARILQQRDLSQTEAAHIIRDSPSQISLLVTGKTKGFSAARLLRMLTRLGRDVDLVIRKTRGGKAGKVRLSVK